MPEENDCEMIGYVVKRSCRLEDMMRRAGGSGCGLRELSESLGGLLGEDSLKLLRYVGAVRNQMSHELNPSGCIPLDMEVFDGACNRLEEELAALLEPAVPDDPVDELTRRTDRCFLIAGFIPGLHVLYSIRLFFAAVRPGAGLAVAAFFGLLAIVPLPEAFSGRTGLFYLSGGLLLCAYAYGIWHTLRKTPSTAPKILAFFPMVNEVYLIWSFINVAKWRILPGSLLLLLFNAAALRVLFDGKIKTGIILLLSAYAATVLTALFCKAWPEKETREDGENPPSGNMC